MNMGQSTGVQTSTINDDRSGLLGEAVQIAMDCAHGSRPSNEQQVSQVLGNLVRSKLLSADDSYRLRDQLMDTTSFENLVNARIEVALRRRGLMTETALKNLQNRIQHLETKAGRA